MPRKLIYEHRLFLGVFAVYLVIGAFSFLCYQQGSETLFFDRHHTPLRDSVFAFLTLLAEWVALTAIGIALLFIRMKYLFVYLIDLLVVALVIFFLKFRVFPDRVRPALFMSHYKLHFVQSVPILTENSFPSGHTAVAFSVAFLLAIFMRRTWASMLLLGLAFLVGISRMYLMEHFWIDVYFGSLIGILITLLVYIGLQKPMIHSESRFLDLSLYERIFKRK